MPKTGGGVAVRYGHPQDWQVLEKSKPVDLQAYQGDAAAQDVRASMKPEGLAYGLPVSLVTPGKPMLLAARYDNGLWARLPKVGDAKPKAVNTTRMMLPAAELVTNNLKFAKGLVATAGDDGLYKRQLGHLLERVNLRAKGVNMLGVDVEKANDGSLGEASRQVGADKFVLVATYTFVR